MTTWWYFKKVMTASLKEQEQVALEYVSEKEYWLGQHPDAKRRNSENIKELIYSNVVNSSNTKNNHYTINKGDTVWVYNLSCIGSQNPMIYEIMQKLHDEGIILRVYTLEKSELPEIIQAFKEISDRTYRQYTRRKKKQKVGHPAIPLKYSMLSPIGKADVRKFCTNKSYKVEDAARNLCAPEMFIEPFVTKYFIESPPQSFGIKKYYALAEECMDILIKTENVDSSELRKLGGLRKKAEKRKK